MCWGGGLFSQTPQASAGPSLKAMWEAGREHKRELDAKGLGCHQELLDTHCHLPPLPQQDSHLGSAEPSWGLGDVLDPAHVLGGGFVQCSEGPCGCGGTPVWGDICLLVERPTWRMGERSGMAGVGGQSPCWRSAQHCALLCPCPCTPTPPPFPTPARHAPPSPSVGPSPAAAEAAAVAAKG